MISARSITIFFNIEAHARGMEVKVQTIKSPDFKQIYAIGAIGGHSPYDFRIAFYNDSPKASIEEGKSMTVMERKIDAEIILSPLAAKELAKWLAEHVNDYEKLFGEIKRPGSVGSASAGNGKGSEPAAIQGYM